MTRGEHRRRLWRRLAPAHPVPPCVGCLALLEDSTRRPRLTMKSVFETVADLAEAVIGDELVVLDRRSANLVVLNAAASLIFTLFDAPRSVGDAVAHLAEETGAAVETIIADVMTTVDDLIDIGLLVDSTSASTPRSVTARAGPPDRIVGHRPKAVWQHRSGPLSVAGTTVEVRSDVKMVNNVRMLTDLMAPDFSEIGHRIDIVRVPPVERADEAGSQVAFVMDGRQVGSPCDEEDVVRVLFDHLDAHAIRSGTGLRFHGGAVERDGHVVLLVGHSGAGKSTLTAALTASGYSYLTDEVISVDPCDLRAHPYCRPLELDADACALLDVRGDGRHRDGQKYQVLPSQLGTASKGGLVDLVVVLSDDDDVTEAPDASPIEAGIEALRRLLPMVFVDTFDAPDAFAHLAAMCTKVDVVTLRRGPIPTMVSAIAAELARKAGSTV